MVGELEIMIAAVVISIGVMLFAAGAVGHFVERHPTLKMLALAFLLLIGMAFSVGVEVLNLRASKARAAAGH